MLSRRIKLAAKLGAASLLGLVAVYTCQWLTYGQDSLSWSLVKQHMGGTDSTDSFKEKAAASVQASLPEPELSSGANDSIPPLRTLRVGSITELQANIQSAEAGDEIVVSSGTYTLTGPVSVSGRRGTAEHPIIIRAEAVGGVTITGGTDVRGFDVSGSSYVIVKGFVFTHGVSAGKGMLVWSSNHVRVTRNKFQLNDGGATSHWLTIAGVDSNDNRVDRNRFEHKTSINDFLNVYGVLADGGFAMPLRTLIDRNYFYDTPDLAGKSDGTEAIRIGDSNRGMIPSYAVIENNLFEKLAGDMPSDGSEAVSVKASNVTVKSNTFRSNKNGLVFRHGNDSVADGNFFIETDGGIRFYGDNMRIVNNYFARNTGIGVRAPIFIESGLTEDDTGKGTDANRPRGGLVAYNTLAGNTGEHIHIGASANPLPPLGVQVVNNIVTGSIGKLFVSQTNLDGVTFDNNIVFPMDTATIGSIPAGYKRVNPLLSLTEPSGLYRLQKGSPAIDAAIGADAHKMTADMDGQPRNMSSVIDIGADEYSAAPIGRRPLTPADVGPNAP